MVLYTESSLFIHFIPNAPHYFQVTGLLGIDFNLLPDMSDVHRNRIVRSNGFLIPDTFINLVNRKNFPLIFHKKQQDIIFNGRDRKSVV